MRYTFVDLRREIESFGSLPWPVKICMRFIRGPDFDRTGAEEQDLTRTVIAQIDAINDVLSPAERNDPLSLVGRDRIIQISQKTGLTRRDVQAVFKLLNWMSESVPERTLQKRHLLIIDLIFAGVLVVLLGVLVFAIWLFYRPS